MMRSARALSLATVAMILATTPAIASGYSVKSVSMAGSGCPASSTAGNAELSGDGRTLEIRFPEYLTSADGKAFVRKNCDAIITIGFPGSQKVRVREVRLKVSGNTTAPATAEIAAKVHFQGQKDTAAKENSLPTPFQGDRHPLTLVLPDIDSGCLQDSAVIITGTSIRIRSRPGSKADSTSLRLVDGAEVSLEWSTCTAGEKKK